eukprot:GILI01007499.1.p1 GENE.GILI01007499.1~~GILI01007499.1.p1  ORF type:complete len:320 (-),score=69.57 GILI01007499.1:234-1151(-)
MDIAISLPTQESVPRPVSAFLRSQYVGPGDVISTDAGYMRGHGTYEEDGKLIASVAGVVERVNKLICVRPLKTRYTGEIGDVIVGRIGEVGQKRWRVDINANQLATLQLSAVNLPGGIQRRRSEEDQLHMREFFAEEDLMSAEVQSFYSDGAMALHTRSLKYGKLMNGLFVRVLPALVKRVKHHFHSFPCGVDVILGNNGYIWVSETRQTKDQEEGLNWAGQTGAEYKQVSLACRENICRIRNAIYALAQSFIMIYPPTITDVFEDSLTHGIAPKDMLKPEVIAQVTVRARERVYGAAQEEQLDS